jgi:hypothetical protein
MIDYAQNSKESPVSPNQRIAQMYRFCLNSEDCYKIQLSNYLGEYGVQTCLKRGDIAPCGACLAGRTGMPPLASAVARVQAMIEAKPPLDIKHLILQPPEYRALNYLLNTEQIYTELAKEHGKWCEVVKIK